MMSAPLQFEKFAFPSSTSEDSSFEVDPSLVGTAKVNVS